MFQSTRIFRGGQGLFCSYAHQNWILNPLLYCAVPICNLLSPWKYRLIKIIQRTAHEGKTTRISWGPYPVVPVHCSGFQAPEPMGYSGSQVPVTGGHKLTCPVGPRYQVEELPPFDFFQEIPGWLGGSRLAIDQPLHLVSNWTLHLSHFVVLISWSVFVCVCAFYLVHLNVDLAMVLLEQWKEDLGSQVRTST